MNIFVELSIIILLAAGISILMKILKQPFIVGYILTGILVGPYFLNILHSKEDIELFSKIGITMLLFIVGLHLNPTVIKEVGSVSLVTGLGQVIFTTIIGYFICIALGLSPIASIYVAIALTFSSTIIILKLLSDKGDLETLYGKISIGFLLIQDLVATIVLIIVTTIASTVGKGNIPLLLSELLIKGSIILIILIAANRYIIPKVSKFFASSQELLFLSSLAWGLGIAALFQITGFSVEIGALAAGIALSTTPFATEIGSRMKPLRDFFVFLFFILLGSQMVFSTLGQILVPTLVLSIFVIIGNPLIVIVLMNLLGFKRRTGFMTGLTMAQISEFSLILIALGVTVGHLSSEIMSIVTLVGLITIAASSYLILYSEKYYLILEPILKRLEFRKIKKEKTISTIENPEIILFGYDRVGSDFVKAIKKLEKSYIVIDINPKSIKKLESKGIPCAYGDAEDIEFLEEIGVIQSKLVISTIPSFETNKLLTNYVHKINPKAIIMLISHNTQEAIELYKEGATYVVMPHYLGAEFASNLIVKHGLSKKNFLKEQKRHHKKLTKRNSL